MNSGKRTNQKQKRFCQQRIYLKRGQTALKQLNSVNDLKLPKQILKEYIF